MAIGEFNASGVLAPEEVGPLIIQPLRLRIVALRVSTVIESTRPSLRFLVVDTDAAASWLGEGDDITESDPDLGETMVTPTKLAALTQIGNELIADSAENARAAGVVGDGLVRSFAGALDKAFFTSTTALGPNGVESLTYQEVNVGGPYVDFDPFANAISLVERIGSVVTSFAASFNTVLDLALVRRFQNTTDVVSNEPLLAQTPADVSHPLNRTLFGVPLYSAPEGTIEDGVVWAIAADTVFSVMRQDISITVGLRLPAPGRRREENVGSARQLGRGAGGSVVSLPCCADPPAAAKVPALIVQAPNTNGQFRSLDEPAPLAGGRVTDGDWSLAAPRHQLGAQRRRPDTAATDELGSEPSESSLSSAYCLRRWLKRWRNGSKGWRMLEVIDKGSSSEAHQAPLLFVHGGVHGAWCWDDHFLGFFADNRYRAIALSLRGHRGSPVSRPLNKCTIAGYVDDVRSVAATLPATPVLIGHSMGGFVVQKYLETGTAPAAVLVSSLPPWSWFPALCLARKHPWLTVKATMTRKNLCLYPTPAHVREVLFCAHTPEPIVEQCFTRLQEESHRALNDMVLLNRVRPQCVTTPILVLEGGDIAWGPRPARENARAYHTEAEFFPSMGHNIMLEPGWQAVAERIDGWLAAQGK